MKKAAVFGAGGFIGSHLVRRLKSERYWVRGVDLKHPNAADDCADEFVTGVLRDPDIVARVVEGDYDELYQHASDMAVAGYIISGDHDARIMHDSALINLHTADVVARHKRVRKLFYSSSACIYPRYNQQDPQAPLCGEDS